MPSSFPSTPDDLSRDNLTHGDVSDALAAVQTAVIGLLGSVAPQGPKGDKGDKGDPGDTGPAGPAGPAGADGTGAEPTDHLTVLESAPDDSPTVPEGEQWIQVSAAADPTELPPYIRAVDSAGNSWALATSYDLANTIPRSIFGGTGQLIVGFDPGDGTGALTATILPGTDGQVLTADSTSFLGLSYTDPRILHSPNGTAYRLVVADDGTLSTEPA